MSSSHEEFRIPLLKGDNYSTWSIRARALLIQKNCLEAIDPGYSDQMTNEERKVNDKALSYLHTYVDNTYIHDIGACTTAKEAWEILEELNTRHGLLHILQLMRELFNIKMKKGEQMRDYLGRIVELHIKLVKCGHGFNDKEVALIMLLGLPESYEQLILSLEYKEDSITTKEVKAKLILEEKRKASRTVEKEEVEELAFVARDPHNFDTKGRRFNNRQEKIVVEQPQLRKKRKCYCCGKMGYHNAKDCWHRQPEDKGDKDFQGHKDQAKKASEMTVHRALCASKGTLKEMSVWYLDSAATEHMTSCREKLTNLHPSISTVEVANHEKLPVKEAGRVTLSLSQENGGSTFTLDDVLYVPGLDGNLLSIGRIQEKGYDIHIRNGVATILDDKENIILIAKSEKRMFPVYEAGFLAKASKQLWHRRLGHLHEKAVTQMIKEGNLVTNDSEAKGTTDWNNQERCEVCMTGKMKHTPFPQQARHKASRPLDLIHSDVMGKITPMSKGGANYIVTFIDDYSGYTKVYFIARKCEVFQKFLEYKKEVELQHGTKIKALRTDNGGEYLSDEFNKYLVAKGIKRQLTVPRSPQQNGVAERKNQTIMNTTRCLLFQSGIPRNFWADAANTACYLRNKCVSKAAGGKTPEELWTGKTIELDHLRVFGCRVWSTLEGPKARTKLDPKGIGCVLIGFPEKVKGYKLWDSVNDKVFVSRNVIFEESIFPFRKNYKEDREIDVNLEFKDQVEAEMEVDKQIPEVFDPIYSDDDEDPDNSEAMQRPDNLRQKEHNDLQYNNTFGDNDNDCETEQSSNMEINICGPRRSARLRTKRDCHICSKTEEQPDRPPDPRNLKEALSSGEAKQWDTAIKEELKSLETNQTWRIVPRPKGKNVVDSKWVFKRKYDAEGKLSKYKARLVARGFNQVRGVDFEETFSPVIKHKSVRILLAIAVERGWKALHMDIGSAYLNGDLNEEVYMEIPETGAERRGCSQDKVYKLTKSIYGLRQSGREWNEKLDKFLKENGLTRSKADPCVYYKHNFIVGVYVDDLLVITPESSTYEGFKTCIQNRFICKDLGEVSHFLAIKIVRREDGSLSLSQEAYIKSLLQEFRMSDAKEVSTPLPPGIRYSKNKEQREETRAPYRKAVGSLLYLANTTRPDLAHVAAYMGQFSERPTEQHWTGMKHIFRYLKKTKGYALEYHKTGNEIQAYTDADWGSDITDRHSFSGYVFKLAGAAVSWSSRKQQSVATSTVEAEYLAMCESAKESIWITSLFKELGLEELLPAPMLIHADNQGSIYLAGNQIVSERSKHIDLKFFFLRELVEEGKVLFVYIPTKDNPADILTKVPNARVTAEHCCSLGLSSK